MTNTKKQGRPRKPDFGIKRLEHMRESWRKASKKYYEKKPKKTKAGKKKSKK
jgi:hypothetical protein